MKDMYVIEKEPTVSAESKLKSPTPTCSTLGAGGIAAVSALSAFDTVSQHGFETGAWFAIFTGLTVSALAAVSFLSLTDRDG